MPVQTLLALAEHEICVENAVNRLSLLLLPVDSANCELTFDRSEVVLSLELDMSSTESSEPSYRAARVLLEGVELFVIEPQQRDPARNHVVETLLIDGGRVHAPSANVHGLPPLRDGLSLVEFFSSTTNSFLVFGARSASMAGLSDSNAPTSHDAGVGSLRAESLAKTEAFTPAGYRGSLLRGLVLDFAARRASLRFGIPLGSESGGLPGTHVYRESIVDIDGLGIAAVEPQRWDEGFVPRAALRVLRVEDLQPDRPADTFLTRIAAENTQSSIYIAGRAAVFQWSEPPRPL